MILSVEQLDKEKKRKEKDKDLFAVDTPLLRDCWVIYSLVFPHLFESTRRNAHVSISRPYETAPSAIA